jgi:hypothetical protein
MKKLFLLLLLIPLNLFSQNSDNSCNYISNTLKEKPLECIDKTKLKSNEEIYQFFKWSAFKEDYLIRIEKKGNTQTLVQKKINKGGYNQKTGEYTEPGFQIVKQRKLTFSQFKRFTELLKENNFWQKDSYNVQSPCDDGSGVLVYAIQKDHFLSISNGNCSPKNEYLYYLYNEITKIFEL